jgi:hypothetical protein
VLRNAIPASSSKPTVQEDKLPFSLKTQWRHSHIPLFLSDLGKDLFGARYHSLPYDRSITYRVDVCERVPKQVAKSRCCAFNDKPTMKELLSCAKVWLSFPRVRLGALR